MSKETETNPIELKGYRVNIFKSNFGTNQNIVSDKNNSAILVTDGKTGDSSTVMSDEPYLKFVKRDIFGKIVLSAEPINYGVESKRTMFGGAFIWSSDSRFRNDISEQPIQLHDRVEYAEGGELENNQIYKLRAEGLNDFINFLGQGIYFNIKWFKVEIIGVPDVIVTFETNLSLSQLKSKLRKVQDSHVMLETLKPIDEYTGERFEEGGGVSSDNAEKIVDKDRMYNFLLDDLEALHTAINSGDMEEVDRFFSYWNYHLNSLKTSSNDRMYNFLKDDLNILENAIKKGDNDFIESFFSYWNTHLKSLKMAKGGGLSSDNAEKIAKLQKVVDSAMIPDAVKEKARLEIEKIRSEETKVESKGLSAEQREINKKALALINKNKFYSLKVLQGIIHASLEDANYHSAAFEFAKMIDSNIKTKQDWYRTDIFVVTEKQKDVAIQISQMCGWEGEKIVHAYEFVLKMLGFHNLFEKLNKAMKDDSSEGNYPNAIEELTKNQLLYASTIAGRTALSKDAVGDFIKRNGLNEKQTLNLTQGVGMGKISVGDFMTAVIGNPNNEFEEKVVAFAKSDEAFKYEPKKEETGRGWEGLDKGKRIIDIKEFKVGQKYLYYNSQFNSKNIIQITSLDKTELNRNIVYASFVRNNGLEENFAIWGSELKDNEFYEIKETKIEAPIVKDERAKGKNISEISTYIPHRAIESLVVTHAGKKVTLKGSDIFDGIYVENKVLGVEDKTRKNDSKDSRYAMSFFDEEEGLGFKYIKNGKFDEKSFKDEMLKRTSKSRSQSTIKLWARELGMDVSKYIDGDVIENIEFANDSTLKAKKLFKLFTENNPKVARTQFEEETFEFGDGGSIESEIEKQIFIGNTVLLPKQSNLNEFGVKDKIEKGIKIPLIKAKITDIRIEKSANFKRPDYYVVEFDYEKPIKAGTQKIGGGGLSKDSLIKILKLLNSNKMANGGYTRPSIDIKTTGIYEFKTNAGLGYEFSVVGFERESDNTDSLYFDNLEKTAKRELGSIIIKNSSWNNLSKGKSIMAQSSTGIKGRLRKLNKMAYGGSMYADGGSIEDEIDNIDNRIYNLEQLKEVANEDEQSYYETQIKQLQEEKSDLLNKKNKPVKRGWFFKQGGNIVQSELNKGYQFKYELDDDNRGSIYKESGVYFVQGFENGKHYSESFEKFQDAKKYYVEKSKKMEEGGGVYNQTEKSARNWVDSLIKEKGYREAYNTMKYNVSGKNPYFNESAIWVTSAWNRFNELEPKIKAKGGEVSDYTNQTGIKSSLLKDSAFIKLLLPTEKTFISNSEVNIFKKSTALYFTDGKREIVFSSTKPFSKLKKLGNASSILKDVYSKNMKAKGGWSHKK